MKGVIVLIGLLYLAIGFIFGVLSLILGSLWPWFGETVTEVYGGDMTHHEHYEAYHTTKRESARLIFVIMLVFFWPVFVLFAAPVILAWKLVIGFGHLLVYLSNTIDKKMRRY